MTLANELAHEIWAEGRFHTDLSYLGVANINNDLAEGNLIPVVENIDLDMIQRLLQVALIFADTDEYIFREAAQKISTSASKIVGSKVDGLYSMIQGRLANFPALNKVSAPLNIPRSFQYEFVGRRIQQTVVSKDGFEHILTPFQLKSWKMLKNQYSGALSGPTSAGKSYVLLMHLVERFFDRKMVIAVYIVPTRALINQVSEDAGSVFAARGIYDVTITSVPVDLSSSENANILYILTQERLDVLLISNPNLRIDLVIVDEAQMIADGSRGVLLESAIDRINIRSNRPQIIFSGPLIENPEYFGKIFSIEQFKVNASKAPSVTQNIIFLDYLEHPRPEVEVKILTESGETNVNSVNMPISLRTELDRFSYISFVFGRVGSSIVYAEGKSHAEKIAAKISTELVENTISKEISDLIAFIQKHVHKDYSLIETLKKGVGFHYGHMPSLLRKQLEDNFRDRKIRFLVCTSTILHGLNLPAKNIFMYKPKTGRGHAISGPDFWNLSGRAGRMGKELEGNVFLINYGDWDSKPLSGSRSVSVSSALNATIINRTSDLIDFLSNSALSSEADLDLEISVGKLVLDERLGLLERTVARHVPVEAGDQISEVIEKVKNISSEINIPTDVLNKNIGVSVFRQKDLLDYMIKRLDKLPPEELIPSHPIGEFNDILNNYRRVFKRIHTYILNYPSKDNSHNFFAPLSLRWMRGDSLPVLIDSSIRYHRDKKSKKSSASIIRETMENIEKELRFRYVKFFT